MTLPARVSIIAIGTFPGMSDAQKSRERAMDDSVSRAIRDNLLPLQRSIEELQQAYADLVSACASTRPTNALPAMLRAQSCSASVSASLSVLSTFITNVMHRRERESAEREEEDTVPAVSVELAQPSANESVEMLEPAETVHAHEHIHQDVAGSAAPAGGIAEREETQVTSAEEIASESVEEPEIAFDVRSLSESEREMHKRANRVAKVSMQDIKMLKPEEVRVGRENRDICVRLRSELDKARKEYDRRFQKILDQPVDYFHHWLVEILGEGDAETLGEYPYPSPVLRR
ncbi:MAG TPA: hypothetical protein VGR93_11635 [Candidatus Acidoferrales bacterium]|nr:hypothetical protein [Candidatus Acidoferrales bacterium]